MSYNSVARPFAKAPKDGIQSSYPGRSFLRFFITYNLRTFICLIICIIYPKSLLISYEQLTRKSSLLNFNLSGPEMHISAGSRIRFKPISKVLYKSISLRDNLLGLLFVLSGHFFL